MPTYGYRCTDCGHTFEVFQKITDSPVSACEQCGGAVKKQLYPVGIQFKGSGFYVNDYAKSSGPSAKSDAPASEAKPEAKTETGSATKTDTPAPAPAPAAAPTAS